MNIGLFKDMRLVLAIQMNEENINHWFNLEPVRMISKERTNFYDILLSPSVIGSDNIKDDNRRTYYYANFGNWLCRDNEGNWRVFSDNDYRELDSGKKVYRPINRQTANQLTSLIVVNKIVDDFNKMSYEEKLEFAEKYPEFVTITKEYE